MGLLKDILSSSSVVDEQQDQLEQIVSTIVDPLLASVNSMVTSFASTDHDVFLLNTLYQIHTVLSLFQFNDAR